MSDGRHQELSRFSGNGKTFFFNKGKAKTGSHYLSINALYGKGQQERLILFPPHYLEFYAHIKDALENLTGFTVGTLKASEAVEVPGPSLPFECPRCEAGPWEFMISAAEHGTEWHVYCDSCGEYITSSFKDQPHV